MDSLTSSSLCPVCGYDLGFQAWQEESPADEICPSCGIQFGYDDAAGGDPEARRNVHLAWRKHWIDLGMPWCSLGIPRPKDWSPADQLSRVTG